MDSDSSSRLSKDGDVVWVSSEVQDVVLHPAQRQLHVLQAVVSRGVTISGAQESQDAHTVVDSNDHNVLTDEMVRSVETRVAVAAGERATVDPNHDGTTGNDAGRVDVQEETILISGLVRQPSTAGTIIAVLSRISNASPSAVRNRSSETKVTGGRCCVRDSLPREVTITQETGAFFSASHLATLCVDHEFIERAGGVGSNDQDGQEGEYFEHFNGHDSTRDAKESIDWNRRVTFLFILSGNLISASCCFHQGGLLCSVHLYLPTLHC